jgi:diguanylate cyclase (GGDEF)-like protein
MPAIILIVTHGRGAPVLYPQWWFGGLAVSFVIYTYLRSSRNKPLHRAMATLTVGLAIGGATSYFNAPWLRAFYVPYVVAAGIMGIAELAGATIATGMLLGIDYYRGGSGAESSALLVAALTTGALSAWSIRRAESRGKRTSELASAPGEPTALDGLEDEEDIELRDILKAVALALEPACVVLFLHEEGELSFRAATMRDIEAAPEGLAYDVLRYRHSVVSADLESVHYGPGYEREGTIASAAASPVLDGTYIAGVLVADSVLTDEFSKEDVAVLEVFARQVARVLSERRVLGEVEKNNQWLSLLNKETSRLNSSLEPGAIARQAAEAMQKIVSADIYVFIRRPPAHVYTLAYFSGSQPPEQRSNLPMEGTLTGTAIAERTLKYFSDISNFPMPLLPIETPDVKSALMAPLLYHGEPNGVVVMASGKPDIFTPSDVGLISLLGNQTASSLNNARLHAEIKHRALTDGLTGLINHRHFMERLAAEFKRFDRSGNPLSVMLVDADHFKRVNDTYGHPAGDQVLRDLADLIRSALRAQDVPARYGGEEFVAALPDTPPKSAFQIAERLRRSAEKFNFMHHDTHIPVTISIGVATCPFDDNTMPGLIQKADDALYRAKQKGRNRVEAWGGEESSSASV